MGRRDAQRGAGRRAPSVRPYRPGAFFERELPCLLEVLGRVRARPAALVIDGYVELDQAGAPGLGWTSRSTRCPGRRSG
ncbi:hypothetical protein [Sorangium sp. So ce124]|uniref:hypothetical protein n=1 Tax=Sorangium sp. So ce124 TaxID=3133280 RepID=UPI003F644554